ncbi:hypothetical protein GCM10009578_057490 [Streptomyces rhizosphaericus]
MTAAHPRALADVCGRVRPYITAVRGQLTPRKDGRRLTFALRRGLRFCDGTPVNAEAVRKSLERGKDHPESLIASQLTTIDTVRTPDPRTVVLELTEADHQLPALPAGKTGMMVSPTAFGKDEARLATRPVGHGPLRLVSYTQNSMASLRRDPGYWNAGHIAVERFEVRRGPPSPADSEQFGHGEVDHQPFPPGYPGFDPALGAVYRHDPGRARALLRETGYHDGVRVTITTAQPQGAPEPLQAQLNRVGFRARIEVIPEARASQVVYVLHSRALYMDQFAGRESPVQAMQVLFGAEGLMNPSRRTTPELDAAVAAVRRTPAGVAALSGSAAGGHRGGGAHDAERVPVHRAARPRPYVLRVRHPLAPRGAAVRGGLRTGSAGGRRGDHRAGCGGPGRGPGAAGPDARRARPGAAAGQP